MSIFLYDVYDKQQDMVTHTSRTAKEVSQITGLPSGNIACYVKNSTYVKKRYLITRSADSPAAEDYSGNKSMTPKMARDWDCNARVAAHLLKTRKGRLCVVNGKKFVERIL